MNDIVRITCKEGYIYHIIFDNGISGDVDFSEYLSTGPIFEPLRELAFFRKASIEGGTISWPNGADIAPETLYDKILQAQSDIKPEHLHSQPADHFREEVQTPLSLQG